MDTKSSVSISIQYGTKTVQVINLLRFPISNILRVSCRNRCKIATSRLESGSPIGSASDDPAVWLPAMLNQAERLATQFKLLIARVGTNWTKKDQKSDIESAITAHPNPTEEEKQKMRDGWAKRKALKEQNGH